MGDNSFDLESLYIGAKKGNTMDMNALIRLFNRDLRKKSYIGGRFNEDVYQEMSIKLIKCIKKFEYKRVS
jgi:DNA-directed RNA polymerase specialized sigma24 family protein